MKTPSLNFRCSCLLFIASLTVFAADPGPPVERVLFREGKVFAVRAGKTAPLEANVTLPNAIAVSTNGTFTVGKGKARPFQAGQSLGDDGMLASPDGTLVPVFDHIVIKSGRPVLMKDGVSSPVTAEMVLGDGTRVSPDGTLMGTDGRRTKLLDGQMRRLDGQNIAATDTVTLLQGKVVLQKDGSRLELKPGQTIAMSDGSKVSSDGTLSKPNGTTVKLIEGQTVTVEGVSTRPR